MNPRRVIIDTDPGIDDSAAIFFAFSGQDGLPVSHGSNITRTPPGDFNRNVEWPSQVTDSVPAASRDVEGLEGNCMPAGIS